MARPPSRAASGCVASQCLGSHVFPIAEDILMGTQAVMAPADCFARVSLIRREIDDLRAELGRPEPRASTPAIENAEPRACWVAALGLLARADRLAQETGIDGVAVPFSASPIAATQPADVLALL